MKKIKGFLSQGYPAPTLKAIIEVKSNATKEEIEIEVIKWACNYINLWWEDEEENK